MTCILKTRTTSYNQSIVYPAVPTLSRHQGYGTSLMGSLEIYPHGKAEERDKK